jgi:hypothetical protein
MKLQISRRAGSQTHGYSNRVYRLNFSRHTRELISFGAIAIAVTTTVIIFWLHLLLSSGSRTQLLDNALDNYYATTACIRGYEWETKKQRDQISKVETSLANARRQVPFISNDLWNYISQQPLGVLYELEQASSTVHDDLRNIYAQSKPSGNPSIDPDCPPVTQDSDKLRSDLRTLDTRATRLTSVLAAINTAQGLLPIIAIVGSFLTAVVAFGGWLYRTADARLSVVDLIAGEIFSICRAAATNRSVEKLINAYETASLSS